jgi:hypothetical protein
MYDKKTGMKHHALIKEVAQKKRYYTREVESSLNTDVEIAGTRAMKLLIQGLSLSDQERVELSRYIATMIKRVPFHRNLVETKLYPDLLAETTNEYRNSLRTIGQFGIVPVDVVDQKLSETDAAERKLSVAMPKKVRDLIEDPRPSHGAQDPVAMAISNLGWRVLRSSGPSYFVTSDNPVYRYSELIFPLSTTHCLHADPQEKSGSLRFAKIGQDRVRIINKRVVAKATRYAYYAEDAPWVHKLLNRSA